MHKDDGETLMQKLAEYVHIFVKENEMLMIVIKLIQPKTIIIISKSTSQTNKDFVIKYYLLALIYMVYRVVS